MNIKDKIKYEMISFLTKRCNRSTVQIEINGCERAHLMNQFSETRYENAIRFITSNNLRAYLSHRVNDTVISIASIDFKLNKLRTVEIQKRIRILRQSAPYSIKIRMTKTRQINLNRQERNFLRAYARRNLLN